jgi:ABC-type uncharacterized transport system substrate-binding protein
MPKVRGDMKRREFVVLLSSAAMYPLVAAAQSPTIPIIGFLSSRSPDESAAVMSAFRHGLGESGVVGRNFAIEYRWAEGHYDRLPALAGELISERVAVILAAVGPPAVACREERDVNDPDYCFGRRRSCKHWPSSESESTRR